GDVTSTARLGSSTGVSVAVFAMVAPSGAPAWIVTSKTRSRVAPAGTGTTASTRPVPFAPPGWQLPNAPAGNDTTAHPCTKGGRSSVTITVVVTGPVCRTRTV